MDKIEPYKGLAGIYEEIRPSYPDMLIQDIINKNGLVPGDSLLEIGAGTGKATIQFAEKGFIIHAIEIGEDMAVILKNKCTSFSNVTITVMPFEEWECPSDQKFDMIYSAQAFHWIDKNLKYRKCYDLLKDNGFLVLFWYNPSNDKLPISIEIEEKVQGIVDKYTSGYLAGKGTPERRAHDGISDNDERRAEIEASGLFAVLEKVEYIQEIQNNPRQYLMAMKSVPAFASILDGLDAGIINQMDNEISQIINNYGGYVSGLMQYSLYLCKKLIM